MKKQKKIRRRRSKVKIRSKVKMRISKINDIEIEGKKLEKK